MVRLKNRYLLVNILYPELEDRQGRAKVPDVVEFNQPTTDAFTAGSLLKGLRAEIANMFGDYGSGAVAESMTGTVSGLIQMQRLLIYFLSSKISFFSDFNLYPPSLAGALQDCLGCTIAHDFCPSKRWRREELRV